MWLKGNLILMGYVGCWAAWANWTSICYYNSIMRLYSYIYILFLLSIFIFY
ncbi:Ubiquitin-conjugating enzyme E2 2 [Zea mays]|uniref:Ubiquitin-conjugating enzyme E2 2 n=1 Tax=Zea mays TaxID=4577 RepID=A0A1D6HT28_MAIZE|nr:Ubiquitin-conjugating enzyme E2 2 [Zea mays]